MVERPAYYQGVDVTCYPSSNAKDDGKLNMEFNMARLVTRVTTKNFCIVNPSFTITAGTDSDTGNPILTISEGQCSINGMDLIMTNPLSIAAPTTSGTYYLGLKLYRDGKGNVQGDFERGVDTIFQGVYLDYYTTKDETDRDILWLGSCNWSGLGFSNIEEDEDKYGRIWAHDILCKIVDPKHPNVSRLLLQDWLYNVPDWYVSKEGDIMYGNLQMTNGRNGGGGIGIDLGCSSSTTSEILIKAPSTSNTALDKIGKLKATDTTVELDIGKTILKVDSSNGNAFTLNGPNNVTINSNKIMKITGTTEVDIGTGSNGNTPLLVLKNHKQTLTDNTYQTNKYEINFASADVIDQILGKATIEYNANVNVLGILATNVDRFEVAPYTQFNSDITAVSSLYFRSAGSSSTATMLGRNTWKLTDTAGTSTTTLTGQNITMESSANTQALTIKKSDNTQSAVLDTTGSLVLTNKTTKTPHIDFSQGSASYDLSLSKVADKKALDINGELDVTSLVSSGVIKGNGLQTTNGVITFILGNNNATITKTSGSTLLTTNGPFNVGSNGTQPLKAGTTTITGDISVTGNYVTTSGNITTTNGTITGKKVLGACYQDVSEAYEKDKEEIIEEGDLVFITEDGKVSKPQTMTDCKKIIGVCSEHAGLELGTALYTDETRCMVGILGKLYVKTEQDFLKCGDYVKAVPGGVRKVTNLLADLQFIVGKVIEPYKDGKVRINFRMAL